MKPQVFIIAGHNGYGTGAHYATMDEGAATIELRDSVTSYLRSKKVDVINDDNKEKLSNVIQWLTEESKLGDLILDIHFNASAISSATGTEVILSDNSSPKEKTLGDTLGRRVAAIMKLRYRGIKAERDTARKRIALLNIPTGAHRILLEVCFISNGKDVEAYTEHYTELVSTISSWVMEYIQKTYST